MGTDGVSLDCVGVVDRIWSDRKSYDLSIGKKSIKIVKKRSEMCPRATKRPQSSRRGDALVHVGGEGPRAAANYQRNRLIDKNSVGVDCLTRRWADDLASSCIVHMENNVLYPTHPLTHPPRKVKRCISLNMSVCFVLPRSVNPDRLSNYLLKAARKHLNLRTMFSFNRCYIGCDAIGYSRALV